MGPQPVLDYSFEVGFKDRCTQDLPCLRSNATRFPNIPRMVTAIHCPALVTVQMMGRASRPNIDDSGRCVLMCHTPRKEYYKKVCDSA